MANEFRLPDLGEQVESGDLVRILISVGDRITQEQSVLELETDKADFEVPADVEGIVEKIHVKEGDKVKVGQLIFTLKEDRPSKSGEKAEEEKKEPERLERKGKKVSGKSATEQQKKGAPKETGAEPAEEEVEEETEGRVKEEEASEEEIREIEGPEDKLPVGGEQPAGKEGEPEGAGQERIVPAAPSIRRLARELGIDIGEVQGTGPEDRISAEDVKDHARRMLERGPQRITAPGTLPDFARWGPIERRPMSRIRRQTARNMSFSWSTIPHVTHFDKADITELDLLQKRFKETVESAGGRLTVTAMAVKTVASALGHFPQFRSSLDRANEEIITKDYFHIGVAVDTDRGLLVPVIRDVDRKSLLDIAVELTQLAEKARGKKIRPEELEGGVFTVTNLGGTGGTQFAPIVYAPQVAILGISRARLEPVFKEGRFEARLMLPISLSYDHRVIDGADAARFVRWVVEALEQPFILTLTG